VNQGPRETIQPKKEEGKVVAPEKLRNSILRVLERRGAMNGSTLKNFAGQEASKEEWLAAIGSLAHDGKIIKKDGIRAGSFKVWLPGTVGPRPAAAKEKVAPSNEATEPSKKTPRVNRKPQPKPLSTTGSDGAGNKKPPVYEAVLADLELRRQKIDHAIAALRALA